MNKARGWFCIFLFATRVLTTPSVRESITADLLNRFGSYLTAEIGRMIDGAVSAMRTTLEGNISELQRELIILREKTIVQSQTARSDEVSKLYDLIKEKDLQIIDLREKLCNKNKDMSSPKNKSKSVNKGNSQPSIPSSDRTAKVDKQKSADRQTQSGVPPARPVHVDANNKAAAVNKHGQAKRDDALEESKISDWTPVHYDRNRRMRRSNTSIVGTSGGAGLVSRLHGDTTEDSLLKYLSDTSKYPAAANIKTEDFIVEKLNPKYKDARYSSFKVGVPEGRYEEVMSAAFWPTNVFVNRFFKARNFQTGLPPADKP